MLNKIFLLFVTLFVLVVGAPLTVTALEPTQADEWQFAIEVYLWGTSIGGKSASGSDVDIELSDILDSLKFTFMGVGVVRKGKWWLAADVIFLNTENSNDIAPSVKAKVELTNWIITPLVGYSVVDMRKYRLNIGAGARFLHMQADLQTEALTTRRAEFSGQNWDGVIAASGIVDLGKKWHLLGYLDIGTGESDFTWQAMAAIEYRFFKWLHVNGGYRYLAWEFDDNSALDRLNIGGPFLGVKFAF